MKYAKHQISVTMTNLLASSKLFDLRGGFDLMIQVEKGVNMPNMGASDSIIQYAPARETTEPGIGYTYAYRVTQIKAYHG